MQEGPGGFLKRLGTAAGLGVLIPYALFALWMVGPRLDSVLSFGGDDGFELCKSALLARRPELAAQMWNDQPWLHTMLNAALFRLLGEHAAIPRVFSLVSLGALLGAATYLLRGHLNWAGGLALSLFLLAGEGMSGLAVSAMLELPAISWAMVAAALAATPPGTLIPWRLVGAGALLAGACHLKFTALIVLPALLVMVWTRIGGRRFGSALVWGALGFVTIFSLLVRLSPSFDWEQLWVPHTKVATAQAAAELAQMRPHWHWVWGDPAPWVAALFAFVPPEFNRRRWSWWFPLTLLGTAASIAVWHRPWWSYYLIHFQVPLAMLGAVGVSGLSRELLAIWRRARATAPCLSEESPPPPNRLRPAWALMGGAAVLALWGGFALPRWMNALAHMEAYSTAAEHPLVIKLQRHREQIRWCYTELRDVAFHARVLIPPELIVLSRKRFWCGALDEPRRWNWVRFYGPEAIVVSETSRRHYPAVESWLRQGYVLCAREYGYECWLARSLNPEPLAETETRLERLGL